MDQYGTHLLGRVQSPFDGRDEALSDYLDESLIDRIIELIRDNDGQASAVVPAKPKLWSDRDLVLNQGHTNHCVGNGWAQWGNTLPVDDHFAEADAASIYYAAKVIDGEPGMENGSTVRSGALVMKARGRLGKFAFAGSVHEIAAWLEQKGSVVMGTSWTQAMFQPDADGFVVPAGPAVGGHCYLADGFDPDAGAIEFLNSWGPAWGLRGRFKMKLAHVALLLRAGGEACTAVELPAQH